LRLHRIALCALVASLALGAPLAAAEGQGTELFAGYSFARLGDVSRHGANLSAGFDLFGPVDGVLDASLHRGSSEGADVDDLTLMAGPGVRFGKKGGTIVYVRALAGLVRDRASIDVFDVSISGSRTGFGLLAGGGVDLPLTRSLAVRAQGDYLRWDSGGDEATCAAIGCPEAGGGWESGFRASAGIVFRFGTAR
jgi:opacity protein-like surface antigen